MGTIWFTGLSGAGKTSTALKVIDRLRNLGLHPLLLDGDELRVGLNNDLSFDRESRRESVRRATEVALLASSSGFISVASLISPYQSDREYARSRHKDVGYFFLEVFIDTPLEVCQKRDPKKLYAKAKFDPAIPMTGMSDPYERPSDPDLTLTPEMGDADQLAGIVMDALVNFLV